MTKSVFSGHCERFEESRGNLKTSLLDFGNRPFRRNDRVRQSINRIGIRRDL